MSKPVTIELVVDSSGAVSGIRQADGSIIKLGSTVDKTDKKVRSFGGSFDVALGTLAAGATSRLISLMGDLTRQAGELVWSSSDLAETQNKYNTVFGKSAGVTNDFINSRATMMGLTDVQAQELLSTTGAILQGAGMTTAASAEASVAMGTLAGDIASFSNKDPAEVFRALQSATTGEREQLKSLGIVINEADMQHKAFAMTGKTTASALTQSEKAAATLELASEKAGVAVGDLERTSTSTANQQKQLKAVIGNVVGTMQGEMAPALDSIVVKLLALTQNEEVLDAVRAAAARMAEGLIFAVDAASDLVGYLSDNRDTIATTAKVTGVLTAAVLAWHAGAVISTVATRAYTAAVWLYSNASRAAAIGQRLLNLAMKANPIGLIISAITIVVGLIWTFRKNIVEAAATFTQWVAGLIKGLGWIDRLAQALGMSNGLSGMLEGAADSLAKMGERMDDAGDSAAGLTGEMEETTGAGADLETQTDNTSASLDNLTTSADKVKGVLAQAREQVSKLTAELRDINAASPEVVASLRQQERALQDQIDLREKLIDSIVERQAAEAAGVEIGEIPLDFEMPDGAIELPELPMGTIDFGDPLKDVLPEWKHQFETAMASWGPSVQQAMSVIGEYSRAAHQARMQQIEEEEAAELERFDLRIARIDEQLAAEEISDERRVELEAQKRSLVAQREAAEAKYEKARRKATREQAEREKRLALIAIAFETAKNVVKAFPKPWEMAAAAALGVAQAAVVARQPLPALNRGGFVPGGGPDEDSVLAYLTPGEAVINRRSAGINADVINTMNRYPGVRVPRGSQDSVTGGASGQGESPLLREVRMMRREMGKLETRVSVMIDDGAIYDANARRQRVLDRNTVS